MFGSKGEKELQKKLGTTKSALKFYNNQMLSYLAQLMQEFIVKQEMVFISTSDANGECDASVRFGEKGFMGVLDDTHLIYAELKGNGVMASMGNLTENPHIGLLFVDFFETKIGLHVNGSASIISTEELDELIHTYSNIVQYKKLNAVKYILIEVEEAYIHCSLHIPLFQKIDKSNYPKKFKMFGKGGDAFGIQSL